MSDAKIKIVSNPYLGTLEFYYWDDDWSEITRSTNPNSKLLRKDLTEGFFPFKAQEVIDTLYSEYRGAQGTVSLVFEGSDDEFEELSAVCATPDYADKIELERGPRSLSNARDVLPEIVSLFQSIRPLVDESVSGEEKEQVDRDLEKFYDVSSDLIPLCVLGNYSAGKSTFINALIGHELLPNGDMPITAKVFQIKRSRQRDRARIRFEVGGQPVTLKFGSDGLSNGQDLPQNPLCARMLKALGGVDGMIPQMNKALQLINGYRAKGEDGQVADLIKIDVPFCQDDPWALTHEFVIFDTPGSNSATNEDHIRVLRAAMDGLSNGLPIYIAEYSSLDSTDNEKLYDEIRQIEAMDERFAMIVVNKADAAELPKGSFSQDDVDQIMDMAVPRHLYAQGIYFVSSVLGLGAKTQGEFSNDNYAEKYEDQERKYSNPDNRFYKMLYRYDILPGQISARTNAQSQSCPDLILANSGLYCVEQEIVLFAERYSAYNKCHLSEALLNRIIDITSEEIRAKEEDLRHHKEDLEQQLEKDKAQLLADLDACGEDIEYDSIEDYPYEVAQRIEADGWFITREELEDREDELLDMIQESRGYSEDVEDAEAAGKAVRENLRKGLGDAFDALSSSNFSEAGEAFGDALRDLADDVDEARSKREHARRAGDEAEIETSERLLEEVKDEFDRRMSDINATVDMQSREFWQARSEQGRDAIYRLATNSAVLSEEKRQEIAQIIIRYPALAFESNVDEIFDKSKFDSLTLLNILFYQRTLLDLHKVCKTFNSEVERSLEEIKDAVRANHEASFRLWLHELLGTIKANITEYNPVLNRHVRLISEDEMRILELTRNLDTLQRCTASVSAMIDWRG